MEQPFCDIKPIYLRNKMFLPLATNKIFSKLTNSVLKNKSKQDAIVINEKAQSKCHNAIIEKDKLTPLSCQLAQCDLTDSLLRSKSVLRAPNLLEFAPCMEEDLRCRGCKKF